MNDLSRHKRHSSYDGITKPGKVTGFALDSYTVEIGIIHSCFGYWGQTANHEFKKVVRGRRTGHLRQCGRKQFFISCLSRVRLEMLNQKR